MVYNKLVKYPVDEEIVEERRRNARLIDARPPYRRLSSRDAIGEAAVESYSVPSSMP
jgi:hypothetical protein